MSMSGEEKTTLEILTIAVDSDGKIITIPMGVYLEDDPTLDDEEQHRLRLTIDAKLMTYDPVIDAKVDDILTEVAGLDGEAMRGTDDGMLAADGALEATLNTHDVEIKADIATAQADLDNPGQYKANVAALALEATLDTHDTALGTHDVDIKADIATAQADLDNPGQYKADVTGLQTEVSALARYNTLLGYTDGIEALLENAEYGLAVIESKMLSENLIINPGFETGDDTGWAGAGAGSWAVQSVEKKHGTYAGMVEANIADWYVIHSTGLICCYPTQKRNAYAYMKADANISVSYLRIRWLDIAGVYISEATSDNYGGNYDWTFRELIAIAPDEAYYCQLWVHFRGAAAAGVGYFDSCNMPQMTGDGAFFEDIYVGDLGAGSDVDMTEDGMYHACAETPADVGWESYSEGAATWYGIGNLTVVSTVLGKAGKLRIRNGGGAASYVIVTRMY